MKITKLNELIEDGKKLKGKWRLGKDGELQYRSSGLEDEVKLRAILVSADPDALVLSLTDRQSGGRSITHLAKLAGAWNVDKRNRLVFEAERESGKKDELAFEGAWKLDKNQQLAYRLKRTTLKKRIKREQELAFSGSWDLSGKNQLMYTLSGGSGSALRLRGAFQTEKGFVGSGKIRYQLGAEASRSSASRALTFFGRWTASRDGDQITLELKTRGGKDLGAELVLTREVLGGNLFLRLKKGLEESRIEAGAVFRW